MLTKYEWNKKTYMKLKYEETKIEQILIKNVIIIISNYVCMIYMNKE